MFNYDLLRLDYRLFEIIIVDDGSDDNTAEELISTFDLQPSNRPIHRKLDCKPEKGLYEPKSDI